MSDMTFHWAEEYHQRGYDLAAPEVARDVGAELFRDADPIAAFVEEAVVVTGDDSHYAGNSVLFDAFRKWWNESGRDGTPDYTKHQFGIALSGVPQIPRSTQKWIGGKNQSVRKGIRILGEYT